MAKVLLFYVAYAFFCLSVLVCVEAKSHSRNLSGQTRRTLEEFKIVPYHISVYSLTENGSDYNIRPHFKLYSPNRPSYVPVGGNPNDSTLVTCDWIVDGIPFKDSSSTKKRHALISIKKRRPNIVPTYEVIFWNQYPYIFHTGISSANPRLKNLEKKRIALSISMVHTDHVKRPDDPDKTEAVFRSAVTLFINFKLGPLDVHKPKRFEYIRYNVSMVNYTFSTEEENTIDAKIDIDSNNSNDLTTVTNFHADFKGFDVSDERQRTIHLRNPDEDQSYLSIHDKQIENGESGKGTRTASAKFTLNSTVASKYRGVLKTGFSYYNYYSDVKVTFDATNLLTQPEQSRFGLFGQPVGSFFKFLLNDFNFTWSPSRPGIIPCFAVGYPLRKIELHKIVGGRTVQMDGLTDYRTSFDTKYEKLSFLTIPNPNATDAGRYVCYSKVNTSDTSYSTFHQEYDVTWVPN